MNERPYCQVVAAGILHDRIDKRLVTEPTRSSKGIFDESGSQSSGKLFGPCGDDLSQFEEVFEGRPAVEGAGRIDRPGLLCLRIGLAICVDRHGTIGRPPTADGVKVFHPKPDRVDLAMTARALRRLLVQHDPLPSRERLAGEP